MPSPSVGDCDELDRLRQQVSELETALETRSLIGEALGILMERYQLTEDEAFDLLSRVASEQESKVREVAETMVVRRELPPGTMPRGD